MIEPSGVRLYHGRSTGRYTDGRRVKLFARAGRWWVHVELGAWMLSLVWWR